MIISVESSVAIPIGYGPEAAKRNVYRNVYEIFVKQSNGDQKRNLDLYVMVIGNRVPFNRTITNQMPTTR